MARTGWGDITQRVGRAVPGVLVPVCSRHDAPRAPRWPPPTQHRSPMSQYNSRSPPPLQHPVPTHPAFIPEPPSTPASPQGYQRYTSSPPVPNPHSSNHQSSFPPPNAYSHPAFQHSQSQPMAHQQHGAAQEPGIVNFPPWGLDNATAQFGVQLGQNAMHAGQQYVQNHVRLLTVFCC